MATIGQRNRMEVADRVDFGVYLTDGEGDRLLLPGRDVPAGCRIGDSLEVFVYLDSEDRPIATTASPKVEVGRCAFLRVIQVSAVGAFLDWGLPKDLFLPFGEQRAPVKVGEFHVVVAYVDKTGRIAASTKLSKHLAEPTDYSVGSEAHLLVSHRSKLGWEVVVDGAHIGLVFENEAPDPLSIGQELRGYVKTLRPDRKLDLSLQRPGKAGRVDLTTQILAHISAAGGSSTLTDKSSPKAIWDQFGVSKKAYKKALGWLYKQKKIVLEEDHIRLAQGGPLPADETESR